MTLVLPRNRVEEDLVGYIEETSGQNVFACYQCGKCTASCPFSFMPQQVIRFLQLGQMEKALTMETTWICASCLTCSRACPKNVNPAGVMKAIQSIRLGISAGDSDKSRTDLEKRKFVAIASDQYNHSSHALRSYFFANIHEINRKGSRLAPLSNWAMKLPGGKLVAHHLLGIHKSRELPHFARPNFLQWFERHVPAGDGHRGPVVLFHDTFMDYDVPRIGIACTELLELAGFEVVLSDTVCCGRPMISKGYITQAKMQARTNVERLYEPALKGLYIVGCEPSCLLTLREEYPKMLEDTELKEKAKVVADQILLIDEFLVMLQEKGNLELEFREPAENERPVLFHGHCQQKAQASAEKSLALLHHAGIKAEMVDAPCCGMAGAFGFEKEHYELSRAASERALLPALRAQPQAEITVMGISCRKQIKDLANRPARHLVEILHDALMIDKTTSP